MKTYLTRSHTGFIRVLCVRKIFEERRYLLPKTSPSRCLLFIQRIRNEIKRQKLKKVSENFLCVGMSKIMDSQRDKKDSGDKKARGRIGMELDLRR